MNCLLWHISLQRADVIVLQRKELLPMALTALSHHVFSECAFVFAFLLHLIYMSNSNYLYYLLKEIGSSANVMVIRGKKLLVNNFPVNPNIEIIIFAIFNMFI